MNGLYIHIPFCEKKCNYCDFASFPSLLPRADEYIDALRREMELYRGEAVDTVYLGGGTPSILTADRLKRLTDNIFSIFDVSADSELTIEVNPCTADAVKAKELHAMGFNRVSLGAQSMLDSELKSLGRLHNSDDIVRGFYDFLNAGFSNISLDLMYAFPGQTMDTLGTTLERMLNLSPEHISCYGLKIEDGTPFGDMLSKGEIIEKNEDEYADMYEFICSYLKDRGYMQYELSNFSKKGFESKHNLKYWSLKDYIGLGLSASSCFKGRRYTRTDNFNKYLSSFENSEAYTISADEKMGEYMMLSLRLTARGANKEEFKALFGKSIDETFELPLKKHIALGLIEDRGDAYILTPKAYYISNSVLCDFI